MLISKSL